MQGEGLFAALPIWGFFLVTLLVVLLSLPMAVGLLRGFVKKGIPEAADAVTAKLDTAFGILFVAGLVLDWTVTK